MESLFARRLQLIPGRVERGRWLQAAWVDPLTGAIEWFETGQAGGRFNPPGRYSMTYLAQDDSESRAEMLRWTAAPTPGMRIVVLVLEVYLHKILDLCDARVRMALGVTLGELMDPDEMGLARSLGAAAFRSEFDGVTYPRPLTLASRNLGFFRERACTGSIAIIGAAGATP